MKRKISYRKAFDELFWFLGIILGIVLQVCNWFKIVPANYETNYFLSIIAFAIAYLGFFGIGFSGICAICFWEVRNDMTYFKKK